METLKAVRDDLDGVPDAIKPFYREEGGRHVLSLDSPKEHPAFVKLKETADGIDKKYRAANQELEAAKDKLADLPDDFDPAIYAKGQNAGDDVDEAVRNAVERVEKKANREIEKLTQRAESAEGQLHTVLVDNGLNKAMRDNKVAPQFMDAVSALIKTSGKIEIADGVATIDNDSLAERVKDFVGTEAGKHFVAAAVNGGGGNPPVQKPGQAPAPVNKVSADRAAFDKRWSGVNFTDQAKSQQTS